MLLPENHIPSLDHAEPQGHSRERDSQGDPLQIRYWQPIGNQEGLSLREVEGELGPIRYDYTATRGSRMYQALADAGMRKPLEALGIEARAYATPGRPTVTTFAVTYPNPHLFIQRADALETPNGPKGENRLTFKPCHGTFSAADLFFHLTKRELLVDVDDDHDVEFHAARIVLQNSAVLTDEICTYADRMWQTYQQAPFGPQRYAVYAEMRKFTGLYDLCWDTPNFADLAANPESDAVVESFREFFSWKDPADIPRLVGAARIAISSWD